ncbi:histidine kinase [Megasphaera cerevisiae DSM 20462]|uniref:Histidine kinase n=1 Tax=Megasphaera cerevisiae DSM 20462 TaxID=1122219 RepID=A0A0J6WYF2_9FIRM|nr:response regulator [Megasphaera cerevisiae]KMO86902.1 histidine kinase [Megasphaera cerevisiae DSM 20462]SJZ79936.1 two component transcriptional regulator, AraC family [Megasphaera cerevisiae DSM 20462]
MHTILIVEDELLEQQFLKEIITEELQNTDKIITCTTGTESIQCTKTYYPDIIFMDILLPELDGLDALNQIRKIHSDVSVVILSGYSDFSYAQKAIHLHVQEYLLKPIRPIEIRQTIRRLLSQHTSMEISRVPIAQESQSVSLTHSKYTNSIEKVLQYIHENFKKKLSLKDVSAHVYMNPQYLSRLFKKEVGVSCVDYINHLKIMYACDLLSGTDEPICHVSCICGFSDQSYFNRVFINQKHITPKEFRRNCKVEQAEIL